MREEFKSYCHQGAYECVVINNNDRLSKEQYIETLKRIRQTIEKSPMVAIDDDSPGNKYTGCDWGLCGEIAEHYPTPELHTFPMDFVDSGRISQLSCSDDVKCPMRVDGIGPMGCFYSCRVFGRKFKTPSKEEALHLYDEAIKELIK